MFDIKAELRKIPHCPGVYIMHEGDLILYVGKAVDLHNRVRQYFQSPKGKTSKILQMVSRVEYFEYIVTDSEMEALILENNLIKKHRPPYNTLLKDDKHYPYLKVDMRQPCTVLPASSADASPALLSRVSRICSAASTAKLS